MQVPKGIRRYSPVTGEAGTQYRRAELPMGLSKALPFLFSGFAVLGSSFFTNRWVPAVVSCMGTLVLRSVAAIFFIAYRKNITMEKSRISK